MKLKHFIEKWSTEVITCQLKNWTTEVADKSIHLPENIRQFSII